MRASIGKDCVTQQSFILKSLLCQCTFAISARNHLFKGLGGGGGGGGWECQLEGIGTIKLTADEQQMALASHPKQTFIKLLAHKIIE